MCKVYGVGCRVGWWRWVVLVAGTGTGTGGGGWSGERAGI